MAPLPPDGGLVELTNQGSLVVMRRYDQVHSAAGSPSQVAGVELEGAA
jgi:hypothetical protein